ncbi:hypothetical protein B0H19DRAFT_1183769 [Mycena capillaripes]|nr:hypothetical protein B0H19DRAFT_1183769 [Mycena capillaripes]
MKSFATIFFTAVGLSGVASGAAFARQDTTSAASSGIVSVSAFPSVTDIGSTTTDILPTTTGGFVVTGIYTTCVTLTFAAPTTTDTATPTPISDSFSIESTPAASSVPPIISSTDATSFTGSTVTIPTASASASTTDTDIPGEAVFTTCLAFLATPTATLTPTPIGSSSATPSASFSVFPSESASAFPSA